jgi:hypothetical protein
MPSPRHRSPHVASLSSSGVFTQMPEATASEDPSGATSSDSVAILRWPMCVVLLRIWCSTPRSETLT